MLKAEHPLWGYRRVWAYMRYRQGLQINKKRVYRLMKEHNLLVTRQYKNKAKRTFSRPKPRADRPNQVWGTDMTKINIGSWGWMYLVIIIDWHTKEIIGHCLSMQSKTDQWLEALHEAVDKRFPHGIRDTMEEQLHLVSDNGCQPSSQRYIKECGVLGINQIFTSWSNPRGNADTERVLRTLKEDLVWCHDWDNPFDFQAALKDWINRYNRDFPHQTLNYMTPEQFYQKNVERGTRGLSESPERVALITSEPASILFPS
jgi:putative transposase